MSNEPVIDPPMRWVRRAGRTNENAFCWGWALMRLNNTVGYLFNVSEGTWVWRDTYARSTILAGNEHEARTTAEVIHRMENPA